MSESKRIVPITIGGECVHDVLVRNGQGLTVEFHGPKYYGGECVAKHLGKLLVMGRSDKPYDILYKELNPGPDGELPPISKATGDLINKL